MCTGETLDMQPEELGKGQVIKWRRSCDEKIF